jgi:hypothetical protein
LGTLEGFCNIIRGNFLREKRWNRQDAKDAKMKKRRSENIKDGSICHI